MSISWMFCAEGAVRFPSGRFTPKAAHNRFESDCRGKGGRGEVAESLALAQRIEQRFAALDLRFGKG